MRCGNCDVETVPEGEWKTLTREERALKKPRFAGFCRRCYDRLRRPRKTWPLRDLVEEAEFFFDGGCDAEQVAWRLGLKHDSLVRQYKRAFDRGLTTRQLDYRRTRD